jgi:DNA polymerase III epsilon subunit-like protein
MAPSTSAAPLAFTDTETTGLDPDCHEIWEVALIVNEVETWWHLPVDLGRADPIALRVGGFHERYCLPSQTGTSSPLRVSLHDFATQFAALTKGCHLVGAVISFDEERLRKLLRANGGCPEWHYHLVDVEALAAGFKAIEPPWNSEELSRSVGIEPGKFDRHTALGDARWAKAIYEAVMTPAMGTP